MKKSLLTYFLGVGITMAADIQPVIHLNFNTPVSGGTSVHNAAMLTDSGVDPNNSYTAAAYQITQSPWLCEVSDDYLSTNGQSFATHNDGSTAKTAIKITGCNLSSSFTLTFAVKLSGSNAAWSHLFAVDQGSHNYMALQMGAQGSGTFSVANEDVSISSSLSQEDYSRITVVYTASLDSVGSFSLYKDASLVGTWKTKLGQGAASIYVGGNNTTYTSNNPSLLIDEVGLYTEALTAEQISQLINKPSGAVTIAAIPEPATATLSLVALAGLAARRRRK